MSKVVKEEIQVSDKEKQECEARKNNIIVFNVPEPNEILKEAAKKKDVETFKDVCTNTLEVTIEEDNILNMYRIGKKDKNSEKVRPLVITIDSEETKKEIFTNLHKIRDAEALTKDMSFDHDQTPLQHQERKELIAKARIMQDNDSTNNKYAVRGPPWNLRIVKRRKKEEELPSSDAENA